MAASVDYEAAWQELEERILERDGWGTRTLVTEMAHLRVKHKSNETEDRASGPGGTSDPDRAGHVASEVPGGRDGHHQHHPEALERVA